MEVPKPWWWSVIGGFLGVLVYRAMLFVAPAEHHDTVYYLFMAVLLFFLGAMALAYFGYIKLDEEEEEEE